MTGERRAAVHATSGNLLLTGAGLTLLYAIAVAIGLSVWTVLAEVLIWSLITFAVINVALVVVFLQTLPTGDLEPRDS